MKLLCFKIILFKYIICRYPTFDENIQNLLNDDHVKMFIFAYLGGNENEIDQLEDNARIQGTFMLLQS